MTSARVESARSGGAALIFVKTKKAHATSASKDPITTPGCRDPMSVRGRWSVPFRGVPGRPDWVPSGCQHSSKHFNTIMVLSQRDLPTIEVGALTERDGAARVTAGKAAAGLYHTCGTQTDRTVQYVVFEATTCN